MNIADLPGPHGTLLVNAAGLRRAPLKISDALVTINSDVAKHLVNTHLHLDHTDARNGCKTTCEAEKASSSLTSPSWATSSIDERQLKGGVAGRTDGGAATIRDMLPGARDELTRVCLSHLNNV